MQRYLNDEPVLACPPSAWYRFRKFARRNKTALVTASVIALAILFAVGSLAGTIGWHLQAERGRQEQGVHEAGLNVREGQSFRKEGKRAEAMAALRRAEGVV